MKKIMFSDRFGLEQAVLDGRKTMTRRILPLRIANRIRRVDWRLLMPYQVGEIVAVAQSYKTIYDAMEEQEGNCKANKWWCSACDYVYIHQHNQFGLATTEGYRNKMFVLADIMPNKIKITDAKLEYLQNISDEDCLKEGIFKYDKPPYNHEADMFAPWAPFVRPYVLDSDNLIYRRTARLAFAYLIDKISGGGTWWRNPQVFAYDFELL